MDKIQFKRTIQEQLSMLRNELYEYDRDQLISKVKAVRLNTDGTNAELIRQYISFFETYMKKVEETYKAPPRRGSPFFDYLVIIDFEATCTEDTSGNKELNDLHKTEIIEFPAVILNTRTCQIVDVFHSFCKPIINPILSGFCTKLTGITQEVVNSSPTFREVFASFQKWMFQHVGQHNFAIVTDSPWDMSKYLKKQCEHSRIDYPDYCRYWVNIRKVFAYFHGMSVHVPMQKMIMMIRQDFKGRAHSGLDDAKNITLIVQYLLQRGASMIINEKIEGSNQPYKHVPKVEFDSIILSSPDSFKASGFRY